jgi:hypothetical protein
MSVKTTRYHKVVDRIHHKLVVAELENFGNPEAYVSDPSELRIVELPTKVTLVSSSRLIMQESPEYSEELPHSEYDSAMECFHDGGGCELEEVSLPCNWKYSADEEDIRFGDFSVNTFTSVLMNLFGGNVKQQLAFDPAMD